MKTIDRFWKFFGVFIFLFICSDPVLPQCSEIGFRSDYGKVGLPQNSRFYDWNGDGRLDFWRLELDGGTSTQKVFIYANTGSGWAWDSPAVMTTTIPAFAQGDAADVFDFNSDGRPDILFTKYWIPLYYTIHLNNGNGTFTALSTITFPEENVISSLGYVDVNSDDILDWVTVTGVTGVGHSIGYRPGIANGTFGDRVDLLTSPSIMNWFKVLGDFNGDGNTDIAYAYYSGNTKRFRVLVGAGDGSFTSGPENSAAAIPHIPTVADINGDGRSDLISIYNDDSPQTRHLFVLRSNGDGSFASAELPVFQNLIPNHYCANCVSLQVGDFTGDGTLDILEYNELFHSFHLNSGGGSFTRKDRRHSIGRPVFSDFDGDGRTDTYFERRNIFNQLVGIVRSNVCHFVGETTAANFGGDDYSDIVHWDIGTGEWRSMDGRFLSPDPAIRLQQWGLASLGDIPAPGDYDGDGRTDHAVYRNSDGRWYILRSVDQAWYVIPFGVSGDIPVPGDYDGGGKTDIAVFRPSNGHWYFWFTESQQSLIIQFGVDGDRPVPADYDGDRKIDPGVYRPSNGTWYTLRSSDGGSRVLPFGISTDIPLPADYDGDGSADAAVYRNGLWYILKSSDNSVAFIYWGTSGDLPMTYYFSRELAAPMVYRPSNRIWYNYEMIDRGIYFGNPSDRPVQFGLPNYLP